MTEALSERLVSFPSVHHAIKAEKLFLAAGIPVTMIPTPREIDVSCGQCLLFSVEDQDWAMDILKRARLRWSKLFSRQPAYHIYEVLQNYEEEL